MATTGNSFLTLIGAASVVALAFCVFDHRVTAFSSSSRQQLLAKPSSRKISTLSSAPLSSPEDDSTESPNFEGFNPFEAGSKLRTKESAGVLSDEAQKLPTTPGGQISPREMRMKALTTNLLTSLSDENAVSELLEANEEFLLEPFNNLDAALETNSVYTPDMGREERFRQYRRVMEERIVAARAPAATKVLGALKDFVLGRE